MVTFTINIPQMLAYIPYMDPMGKNSVVFHAVFHVVPLLYSLLFTGNTMKNAVGYVRWFKHQLVSKHAVSRVNRYGTFFGWRSFTVKLDLFSIWPWCSEVMIYIYIFIIYLYTIFIYYRWLCSSCCGWTRRFQPRITVGFPHLAQKKGRLFFEARPGAGVDFRGG